MSRQVSNIRAARQAVLDRAGVSGCSILQEDGAVREASQYPLDLRERAVRMVAEVTPGHPPQWAAIIVVAQKLGIDSADTLRKCVLGRGSMRVGGRVDH